MASVMLSHGSSRSFIESDDVAELGSRSQPVGYTYRRQNNDHLDDNAANDCEKKSVVPSADDIHHDVCLDSIPLPKEYLVNDPSRFQNWDNLIKIENEYKDPASHSYDLRSKLSIVSVSHSFNRKLDTFLKEARQEANSAFKSRF